MIMYILLDYFGAFVIYGISLFSLLQSIHFDMFL